ncbi:hypothetical protein B296_00058453 [Ensete ventricosum]|uniref:Expansin n=1 Tax=Ensete ventricosum TaxID=4639 RepID=A0A426X163_ENSVE|nr:hypothetical protein B296_00058453 [Ensete ventricosum]
MQSHCFRFLQEINKNNGFPTVAVQPCLLPRCYCDGVVGPFLADAKSQVPTGSLEIRPRYILRRRVGVGDHGYVATDLPRGLVLGFRCSFYVAHRCFFRVGGACGYGNLFSTGYGTATAALSSTLFKDGFACGTCYQIRCRGSPHCYGSFPIITVTGTNLCPPNWAQPSDNGGWCNPPRRHFDLSKPAFMQIAYWRAGIVPVMYRRVPCVRKGGIRFLLQGNEYWLLAFVTNVGGEGDVGSMWVKGSNTDWMRMSHNWGASFQAFSRLVGQSLSFKITSYTTRKTIIATDVAPSTWYLGMTYEADVNFA